MSGRSEASSALAETHALTPSRWLVVVRRDEPALYAYLAHGFEGIALVDVILDRRQRGGPLLDNPATAADAAWDRRRPATAKERSRWTSFGYRMVAPAPSEGALGTR